MVDHEPKGVAPGGALASAGCAARGASLFTLGAVRAQAEIPALNQAARGATETYFCGAWTRYGFHEDGLLSAVNLSQFLLGRDPWLG